MWRKILDMTYPYTSLFTGIITLILDMKYSIYTCVVKFSLIQYYEYLCWLSVILVIYELQNFYFLFIGKAFNREIETTFNDTQIEVGEE
jgi:hypothetical protein